MSTLAVISQMCGINKNEPATINHTVQLLFEGDSITRGVGTTGTGSSASGTVGTSTYPHQCMTILNNVNITKSQRGYPGQTMDWWNINQRANCISLFDFTKGQRIVALFFGANDICYSNLTAT